jgi:hypothetical protein
MATLAQKASTEGDSVLDYLRMCRSTLVGQLAAMNEAGDARGAAYITGQLVRVLESIAKVTGEIGDLARSVTINNMTNVAVLTEHPDFAKMQASLLRALGPYPDARRAVVDALRELEAGTTRAALPHARAPTVAAANGALLELEAS